MLSSDTIYGCYLVFKLDRNPQGLESANAFVRLTNDEIDHDDEITTILNHFARENARERHRWTVEAPVRIGDGLTEITEVHLQCSDGWMKAELGSFYNDHGDDGVDERNTILDPFRRENGRDHYSPTRKPPVRSDRYAKQNSWGRIYRPWGRQEPHPHPSPPIRIGDEE